MGGGAGDECEIRETPGKNGTVDRYGCRTFFGGLI